MFMGITTFKSIFTMMHTDDREDKQSFVEEKSMSLNEVSVVMYAWPHLWANPDKTMDTRGRT